MGRNFIAFGWYSDCTSHSLALNIAGIIRKAVYLCAVVSATMGNEELTEAEAKVYDRQLRIWGVEVQRRWEQTSSTRLDCFDVALIKDPKSSLLLKTCAG